MSKPLLIVLCALALLAGGWLYEARQKGSAPVSPKQLESFELADVEGVTRHSDEWQGKVLVVNHWATWCTPCRDEMPLFIDYQDRYGANGLQVVGIAHDSTEAARRFGDDIGINYPSLIAGDFGTKLLARHGNLGSLPFTLIYDRDGKLVASKLGRLSESELEKSIQSLL